MGPYQLPPRTSWWHESRTGTVFRILLCLGFFPFIAIWRAHLEDDQLEDDEMRMFTWSVFTEFMLLAILAFVLVITDLPTLFLLLICAGAYLFLNTLFTVMWKMVFDYIPLI